VLLQNDFVAEGL